MKVEKKSKNKAAIGNLTKSHKYWYPKKLNYAYLTGLSVHY